MHWFTLIALLVAAAVADTTTDVVCDGVLNPPPRVGGDCGRTLYYKTASYCCWFCHAIQVIKHNPARLFDMLSGRAQYFNFTQCRGSDIWSEVQKRITTDDGDSDPMRKLLRLDRNLAWQIIPSGHDLHCDCCVNICSTRKMRRYCSCPID